MKYNFAQLSIAHYHLREAVEKFAMAGQRSQMISACLKSQPFDEE